MSGTQQPEALRLARKFEEVGFMGDHRFAKDHWCRQAAAELRHQHARIAELEAQLSAAIAAQAKQGGAAMTHHTDDQYLFDAVLNCPHTITRESITLHFSPKQKEGHNALAQLRHRLAAADAAAKAREMELLAVIEDLERLIPLINRGGTP